VRKFYLSIFVFIFCCNFLGAQNVKLKLQIDSFEAVGDHKKALLDIGYLLKNSSLSSDDKLALQLALTHQFQNLELWDTCISYCQQEILAAQKSNNQLAEATFYKAIGNTYYHIPLKAKAIEYWGKCIALSEEKHYESLLENCYHNVGAVHLENGSGVLAEKYFQLALSKGLLLHPKVSVDIIQHKRLLATYYEKSPATLAKAHRLYIEVIEDCKQLKDTALLAEAMLFYSHTLMDNKEYNKAIALSAEALGYCRKQNLIDGVNTALKTHAQNLHAGGKYAEAYKIETELNELFKTRYSNDLNKNISEAEAKFKNAEVKHEQQMAQVKSKKEKQIYLLIFVSILCLAGFSFYYLFQKRNAKQKEVLQQERLQSVLDGEEKERTRIAKDLHDGIVQDLTAIKLQLNANISAHQEISKADMQQSVVAIEKASNEVRNIAYQMMPTTLRDLGFIPAIDDLLKRVLTPSNIHFEFEQFGCESRLPENIEISLFRITQELLNNVLKHSRANTVSIFIAKKLDDKLNKDVVTLIFEDNGLGFDESKILKGIGLNSLQSRVQLLHGNISYESTNGSGAMAIVKVPID
jgi:signal transduction histidine kinase